MKTGSVGRRVGGGVGVECEWRREWGRKWVVGVGGGLC